MDQAVCGRASRSVPSEAIAESAARRVMEVEEAVRAALRVCGRPGLAELDCDCFLSSDNRVMLTLSGHLPSFYLNQVAQETVRRVPGVYQVCNRVHVAHLNKFTA